MPHCAFGLREYERDLAMIALDIASPRHYKPALAAAKYLAKAEKSL